MDVAVLGEVLEAISDVLVDVFDDAIDVGVREGTAGED